MTLKEWEEKYWQVTLLHEGGSRWYAQDTCITGECRRALWNLSDYKVSSVVAGTIWLTKNQ